MANMHDSPSDYSDFQKRGIPGKYYGATIYSGSAASNPVTNFTGSNYGGAGFIVGTGSANIETVQGGTIKAEQLITGEFYPISITKISGGASAYIYVLKGNGA
tara:strand:+ start:2629 stop:2937 length:309 start_codon:yes stop_codon:yes gene_type:complete